MKLTTYMATLGLLLGAAAVSGQTPIEINPPAPAGTSAVPETPAPPKVSSTGAPVVTYGLQSAITRGLEKFPGLDIARKATEIAETDLAQAKHSWFIPSFSVTSLFGPVPDVPASAGPPTFASVDQNLSGDDGVFFRAEFEALQPLFTFGRLRNLTKLARVGVKASQQDEKDQLHELVYNIKRVYFGLAALNTIEAFLTEIELKLGFVEKRIEIMLAKGASDVTESDRHKVQIFKADLQNRQYETKENQLKLRQAMALLLGYGDQIDSWDLDATNINKMDAESFDLDQVLTWVRNNNPQLKRLQYLVDAKKHLYNIAQANTLPVFFLGGTFRYAVAPDRYDVNNPFLVDEFNEVTGGVALGLKQDLSLHLLRDRYIKARVEWEQAQFQQNLAQSAIISDVRSKFVSADFTAKRLDVTIEGLRAARSWVGAELNNYEFGLTPTKDVLEAFIAYAKTKLDFIDATVKYNLAISTLTRVAFRELLPIHYNGDGRS